jgi:dTDP-4-dehydrorhamnose reductase
MAPRDEDVMRTLVAGSAGMLARDLIARLAERGHEVASPPEPELDITDRRMVEGVLRRVEPQILFNCAAYNFVDRAEMESAQADRINGTAVENLCLACRERGIPLVHFSTDYVFDGRKGSPYAIGDEPNPLSAYGRSKRRGETFVLRLLAQYYLVRTSWLFGVHGTNFVKTILAKGRERGELAVVDDERGSPTWTGHLADAVVDLVETGRFGLYHVTNSGSTTWYEFATEILRLADVTAVVRPITARQLQRAARRPAYSVLDPRPLPELLGREMPSWRQGLMEYLDLLGRPEAG